VGTISSSCARQRAEPAVCNTALPSATAKSRERPTPARSAKKRRRSQLGAHVHFSSDTREPANSLGLGPRGARGSTGVSDHFIGL
jgi:hypothetical protein